MLRFYSFITENTQSQAVFTKAQLVSNYLTGAQKTKYDAAITAFAKAVEDKEIYNAAFKDHYLYGFSRGLEKAWEQLRRSNEDYFKNHPQSPDLWGIAPASINKTVKIVGKTENKEVAAFVDAIIGLPDAVKVVKGYIKKGKPPKDAPTTIKPLASVNAIKQARDFMQEAADSFRKSFVDGVVSDWMSTFTKIESAKLLSQIPSSDQARSMATLIFIKRKTVKIDGKWDTEIELKPGAKASVVQRAEESANNIIEDFVNKNTSKLSKIFEKKGAPKNHKITRNNVKNNVIENTMMFEFNDGSSFTINTQVVYKYSAKGKLFAQFPTRFTNVFYADGKKMSMPSEQKIITEL